MSLKLGIPQGRLQAPVVQLFQRAGFSIRARGDSYYPTVDDAELECVLIRPQEMPRYVAERIVDAGVTGDDWIQEYAASGDPEAIKRVADLLCPGFGLGMLRWVLAVPQESAFESFRDLNGLTVSSELVEVTEQWFAERGVKVSVTFSWGATELKSPALAAGIVQPETVDSQLRAHNLKPIATILESRPHLIANRLLLNEESDTRTKLEQVVMLLGAAVAAHDKVRLVIETERKHVDGILSLIPSVLPAAVMVGEGQHVTISAVASEISIRELIPRLRAAGAAQVVEMAVNKIVP
jgi:ATP phosphoribosyltransferase